MQVEAKVIEGSSVGDSKGRNLSGSSPICLCPYARGKFGHRDRHTRRCHGEMEADVTVMLCKPRNTGD